MKPVVALAVVVAIEPSYAQQIPAPALDEVIVTARRVAEDATRLPLAIDVTEASAIGGGGVQDLGSLALAHPGLAFESMWGGSQSAPLLRGLSQPSTAGDNVGVFVDEVYQAGRSSVDVDMLDIARVEVVRGPQNSLYGRSSFAGAINYVSAPPAAQPTGSVQLDAGSDQLRGVRGVWTQRLGDTRWLARVAGGARSAGGTWRSLEAERLGGYRKGSAVLTLAREQSRPGDDPLTFNLRYNHGRFAHPASTTLDAFDFNCGARGAGPAYWSYYCGHAAAAAAPSITPDMPESGSQVLQASLRYAHGLGELRLSAQGSYYRARATAYRDFDGSSEGFPSGVCTDGINCAGAANATVTRFAFPNVVNAADRNVREWAQELRLENGAERNMRWMLGLAGSTTRAVEANSFGAERGSLQANEHLTSIVASNPNRVGPQSPLNSALVTDPRSEQLLQSLAISHQWTASAFGTVQWALSAGSSARFELRAARESLQLDSRQSAFQPDTSADPPPVRFTTVTPRLSIDLARGAHWYGYVSLARGARSGGINTAPGLDARERRFDPEYNWTTEAAAQYRSQSLLRSARVTLYRTDWRHAQITGLATTPGVGTLITTNTAGILARGIEASARLQGRWPLSLDVAFSIADTSFRRGSDDPGSRVFCGLTAGVPASSFCQFGPPRSGASSAIALVPYLDGNQSARAPRGSWNAALKLQPVSVTRRWQLAGTVSLAWQDDVFERPINGLRYGERELLAARVSLEGGPWHVLLWGDNLTDARYVKAAASRGGAFYPSLPRPSDLLYADRRRFGITLGLDLVPR